MNARDKLEEQMILMCLAALFRAAGLARASDQSSTEDNRDDRAIDQAVNFVQRCKDRKVYPTEEKRL